MGATTSSAKIVINTRPIERAAPLSAALAASNHSVVELPLLTLQPRQASHHDELLMQQWLRGEYAVTVVVSPTAAAMAIAYWQQAQPQIDLGVKVTDRGIGTILQPSHIIAVGDATAAVLRQHGLRVEQPLIANNEGMLQMPLIAELEASDQVLMWRGLGGRRLLVDTLRERGIQVDSIAWYERVWPPASALLYQQWLTNYWSIQQAMPAHMAAQAPIVIISSGAAFAYWQRLVKTTTAIVIEQTEHLANNETNFALKLANFDYIVLGDRLAGILHEHQLSNYQVESLDPATIVAAVNQRSSPL